MDKLSKILKKLDKKDAKDKTDADSDTLDGTDYDIKFLTVPMFETINTKKKNRNLSIYTPSWLSPAEDIKVNRFAGPVSDAFEYRGYDDFMGGHAFSVNRNNKYSIIFDINVSGKLPMPDSFLHINYRRIPMDTSSDDNTILFPDPLMIGVMKNMDIEIIIPGPIHLNSITITCNAIESIMANRYKLSEITDSSIKKAIRERDIVYYGINSTITFTGKSGRQYTIKRGVLSDIS